MGTKCLPTFGHPRARLHFPPGTAGFRVALNPGSEAAAHPCEDAESTLRAASETPRGRGRGRPHPAPPLRARASLPREGGGREPARLKPGRSEGKRRLPWREARARGTGAAGSPRGNSARAPAPKSETHPSGACAPRAPVAGGSGLPRRPGPPWSSLTRRRSRPTSCFSGYEMTST